VSIHKFPSQPKVRLWREREGLGEGDIRYPFYSYYQGIITPTGIRLWRADPPPVEDPPLAEQGEGNKDYLWMGTNHYRF